MRENVLSLRELYMTVGEKLSAEECAGGERTVPSVMFVCLSLLPLLPFLLLVPPHSDILT